MRDPFYTQSDAVDAENPLLAEQLRRSDIRPSNAGNVLGNGDVVPTTLVHQSHHSTAPSRVDEFIDQSLDPEIRELYQRSRIQEEEILLLRKQVTDASLNELHLLKEKYILERKLCELRMAFDEQQDDAISATLKELGKKRNVLEENMRLANDLKVEEEEIYIFTSSLLSILAEYNIRPPIINASVIANGTQRLYQHMQLKIGYSVSKLSELHLVSNNQIDLNRQVAPSQSRAFQEYGAVDSKDANITQNLAMHYPLVQEKPREFPRDSRGANFSNLDEGFDNLAIRSPNPEFYMPSMHNAQGSSIQEGDLLPGIEGFQIFGEARPGCTLQGGGYPTNGTTLCIFQWVRELENGTWQYIEGATVPNYVVTADDVGTILAVDCTPMDNDGRQGELVRQYANNQNKITCDPDMQHEINTYLSVGKAIFSVLRWSDDKDDWEQSILTLKRGGYHIKDKKNDELVKDEKYSPELYIKIPTPPSTQFVLVCSDGISLPFSTENTSQPYSSENDIRLRDTIVLTMRYFQNKAVDSKKKGKV